MSPKKAKGASSVPVLVVGAGPTGLVLAHELVRHGVPCRIIDKADQPSTQSKALVIQVRSQEIFAMMGVIEPMVERGQQVNTVNLYMGGESRAKVNFSDLDSPFPQPLMLEQSKTEKILIEALEKMGTSVERQMELTGFQQDDQGVLAQIRNPEGGEETIKTSYLVGCDGAHSLVRHTLDLPFAGAPYPENFLLADVQLEWDFPYNELFIFIKENGVMAIFPMHDKSRVRVLGVRRNSQPKTGLSEVKLEEIQNLVKEFSPIEAMVHSPVWLANFHLHRRRVPRYQKGRVFLAGDAAHIHSPVGGQGMNTGIQDAFNLAWKLALVNQGTAKPEILATYNQERHPVGERVIQSTDRMFSAMVSPNPVIKFVRNHIFPKVVPFIADAAGEKLAEFMSEIHVNYSKSPLSAEQPEPGGKFLLGGPRAGHRAPDGKFQQDGQEVGLFPLLHSSKHQLFIFPSKDPDKMRDDWEKWYSPKLKKMIRAWWVHSGEEGVERANSKIPVLIDAEGKVRESYHAPEGGTYLIRPDGYVAYRSSSGHPEDLTRYLKKHYQGLS